jgi:hypothetical protein
MGKEETECHSKFRFLDHFTASRLVRLIRGVLLGGLLFLFAGIVGCNTNPPARAEDEQYPHPYVDHSKLPFTRSPVVISPGAIQNSPRIGVANFASRVVLPVGAYFVEDVLQEPILLQANFRDLADAFGARLAEAGCNVVRSDPNAPSRAALSAPTSAAPDGVDVWLNGTVMNFEYSRYGLSQDPYDFLYLNIRFELNRAADHQLLWQGDVSAYRKISPSPNIDQQAMARDAIAQAVKSLVEDPEFRSSLLSSGKGG